MSFMINDSDYIVAFWYACCANSDEFVMLLRKLEGRWRLDWQFIYKNDPRLLSHVLRRPWKRYYALCGLQVTELEALNQAKGVYELTANEFMYKRTYGPVHGYVLGLEAAVKHYGLDISKVRTL